MSLPDDDLVSNESGTLTVADIRAFERIVKKFAIEGDITLPVLTLPKTCPTGKRKYYDRETAADAAQRSRERTGENIHAYQCPHCDWWHQGHRTRLENPRWRW